MFKNIIKILLNLLLKKKSKNFFKGISSVVFAMTPFYRMTKDNPTGIDKEVEVPVIVPHRFDEDIRENLEEWERKRVFERAFNSTNEYKSYVANFIRKLNVDVNEYMRRENITRTGEAEGLKKRHAFIDQQCIENGININDIHVWSTNRHVQVYDKDLFNVIGTRYVSPSLTDRLYTGSIRSGRIKECEYWEKQGLLKKEINMNFNNPDIYNTVPKPSTTLPSSLPNITLPNSPWNMPDSPRDSSMPNSPSIKPDSPKNNSIPNSPSIKPDSPKNNSTPEDPFSPSALYSPMDTYECQNIFINWIFNDLGLEIICISFSLLIMGICIYRSIKIK